MTFPRLAGRSSGFDPLFLFFYFFWGGGGGGGLVECIFSELTSMKTSVEALRRVLKGYAPGSSFLLYLNPIGNKYPKP